MAKEKEVAVINPSYGHDTPLIRAIKKQDYETFLELLETEDVNAKGMYDSCALIEACYLNTKIGNKMVRQLLKHPDINVNQNDLQSITALGVAVVWNRAIVKDLLRAGADPDVYTYVRLKGGIDHAGKEYNRWRQMTPISVAVRHHDKELVSLLLKYGASINKVGDLDISPLSMAARGNDVDMMDFLYRKGASLEVLPTNWQEYTPNPEEGCSVVLRKVLKYGSTKCLNYLLDNGIQIPSIIYKKNGKYATPLTYLLSQPILLYDYQSYSECANILLSMGSNPYRGAKISTCQPLDITMTDSLGRNALYYATQTYGVTLCERLATQETICQADKNGDTPFSVAMRRGEPSIVQVFLKKGMNPNATVYYFPQTISGLKDHPHGIVEPAIFHAMKQRNERIAIMLIQKGANLLWKDINGKMPVDYLDNGFSSEFKQFFKKHLEIQRSYLKTDSYHRRMNTMIQSRMKLRNKKNDGNG